MPSTSASSILPLRRLTLARCLELLEIALFPYRPELHYMRGPGPKWRARHGQRIARLQRHETGS